MIISNEEIKMVHLSEIDSVIFESIAISVSGVLLAELSKRKICIMFCDERHIPYSQLVPFSSNYMSSARLLKQVDWADDDKERTWGYIVAGKIKKQSETLKENGLLEESKMLSSYISDITDGDKTNREGFAAKVYFNALFGKSFTRKTDESDINSCLDYGYAVLLALTTREIVKNGYISGLGIHHRGIFNPYNLSCDIMEPFRPLVDRIVLKNFDGSFDQRIKKALWDIPNLIVYSNGARVFLPVAINSFFRNVCLCLEEGYAELPIYEFI